MTLCVLCLSLFSLLPEADAAQCNGTVQADVVALDQTIVYNRYGAMNPAAMIFALRRDVVDKSSGLSEAEGGILSPGAVRLRDDKRPRPIVLRVNAGDCLQVNFQNLISPLGVRFSIPNSDAGVADSPATKSAGIHVNGLQLVNSIDDDGSNVGRNPGSLAQPGESRTYTLYAERENTYFMYSTGAMAGGEGNGGHLSQGLFGAVNVEPAGAEWYRSQVSQAELAYATTGRAPDNHPIIDYNAVYPAGHKRAGQPILRMLDGGRVLYSDINAIITGPGRGEFSPGTYTRNPLYPDRHQPFREFTTMFHDETEMIQAFFDAYDNPVYGGALESVKDGFGINYGSAGVGSEVLANRLKVGPAWDCAECKFEEFFLTSWAVGDPAMIVDIAADTWDSQGLIAGPKATKALYPDDPSNVHHSYINDHVKFRNIHAGPKEHHIFHLHAHQWLFTPDDDNSNYLDAQQIGPGAGYTYEIVHGGSGNRNKTVGDSIFHCHFYPHFAQGMWELWRSHDVLEEGTLLDAEGRPAQGARALPDGEIVVGTPIPAIVPIPGLAMPPMPGKSHIEKYCPEAGDTVKCSGQVVIDEPEINAGYPLFEAGLAGHRPPTPPLDMTDPFTGEVYDGGLPRHIVTGGTADSNEDAYDFMKKLKSVGARFYPEAGSAPELTAMDFHAKRWHDSYSPEGKKARYELNGLPPRPGAPYADPCRADGPARATGRKRTYKAAYIQLDLVMNRAGWHFPQQRITSLWEDVDATLNGQRPPEPLVMRGNTGDCITFYGTNIVPNFYEGDDFQVKTPTDVLGQHIHLVKFDVTSSDGSGNGWNYEDGTMSPMEVRERIRAIRKRNNCSGEESGDDRDGIPGSAGTFGVDMPCPVPRWHTYFKDVASVGELALGARTSIQRWYVDPTLNNQGKDRGLGNVFTHDHFGPSTHQQAGLYATLLTEPRGSKWRHPESGELLGTGRADGGPTSWQANIEAGAESFREFFLDVADFQQAYRPGYGSSGGKARPDMAGVINPTNRTETGLPYIFDKPSICPNGSPTDKGCPTAIMAGDEGTFVVNYRNEPLGLRLRDPNTNTQAPGLAGDLSYAFYSGILRADPLFNTQPNVYVAGKPAGKPLTGDVGPTDPFTPLLRVYDGDNIRIRVQAGANEESHIVTVHGLKWTQEYSSPDSGFRNAQSLGISEQFQFRTPVISDPGQAGDTADHLYTMDSSAEGYWNGVWGLLRSYKKSRKDLLPLPNNPVTKKGRSITNLGSFAADPVTGARSVCPKNAFKRSFDITAVLARDVLAEGTLIYNPRADGIAGLMEEPDNINGVLTGGAEFSGGVGPIHDPIAILYVMTDDLDENGKLKQDAPVEPLILRAAAGDCIDITLNNRLPEEMPELDGFNILPPIIDRFGANQLRTSGHVGLHPQLVEYDVTRSDGANVGNNPVQTVAPGGVGHYTWYAGDRRLAGGKLISTPGEFGGVNLISSDRIKHSARGAVGALIIEPAGSAWAEDAGTRASATVIKPDGAYFRDFVAVFQTDVALRHGPGNNGLGNPLPIIAREEDSEDGGHKAINYRTDPLWFRLGISPSMDPEGNSGFIYDNAYSNVLTGNTDPHVPIFTAQAGSPVRLRILEPGGHARSHVFNLHGHIWQRTPHTNKSLTIGRNPFSQTVGSQEGFGPGNHFDIVPEHGAGGYFSIPGDYLFRDEASFNAYQGLWGILRVMP